MMKNHLPYGIGALILGIVSLASGGFVLPWPPMLDAEPLRTTLIHASAVLLVAAGAAVLFARTAALAALLLASFYALCLPLLHAPRILAQPANVAMWLGLSETLALVCGGFIAWLMCDTESSRRAFLVRPGQVVFAACLAVFGLSHFVYADFTAGMVPAWIPLPLFWAYATGCAHVAASLSLLSGIATRLAATLLAAMMGCFVILLHVPRVVVDPSNRAEWVMLGLATSLTGAAWIIRASTAKRVRLQEDVLLA